MRRRSAVFDLLTERLIRVDRRGSTREALSLPEVYGAMIADEVSAFPALRPHQRHAWHAFLAQLGAIALVRAGMAEPPRDAATWSALLRGLTDGFPEDEPWSLVVDDPAAPAFMQCPAPDGLGDYKKGVSTPDDLDLLVTAKNHDVKRSIAIAGPPEDWIFALVNVQTMSWYGGRGNYYIARMNGGHSSRPCLGFAPADGGPGAHLAHDIRLMVGQRESTLESYEDYFDPDDGHALLWLEPWDGTESLKLTQIDPYFIEICRRIRLDWLDGRIVAIAGASTKARIAAKEAKGDLGDHWTPVARSDGKALSISGVGFRYDRLAKLVLDQSAYEHPPAMKLDSGASSSWRLVARGVAGGKNKTEGYHERTDIVLSPSVTKAMAFGARRQRLEDLAKEQIKEVEDVGKALRFAIAVAASGGKDAASLSKSDREKAYPYSRRLDAVVDAIFFSALQDRFEASGEDRAMARQRFAKKLIKSANTLLDEASETVPCAKIQRYRARARASSAFWGQLWRSSVLDLEEIFGKPQQEEQRVS